MASPSEIRFIEPEFGHTLRIWWAFTWRSILLGLVVGIVAPIVLNVLIMGLALLAGGTHGATLIVSRIVGYVVSFSVQVYVLWSILYKDFEQFAIRLVPATQTTVSTTADFVLPTLGHAVRIWWAWFWRTSVVSMGVTFLASILLVGSEQPSIVVNVLVWIVALLSFLLTGLYVMKIVLRKKFKTFRLYLLAASNPL